MREPCLYQAGSSDSWHNIGRNHRKKAQAGRQAAKSGHTGRKYRLKEQAGSIGRQVTLAGSRG